MIVCSNDRTRSVVIKIERIDIPRSEQEKSPACSIGLLQFGRGCLYEVSKSQILRDARLGVFCHVSGRLCELAPRQLSRRFSLEQTERSFSDTAERTAGFSAV